MRILMGNCRSYNTFIEFYMTQKITKDDLDIINKALETGSDVLIRKTNKGIRIVEERTKLLKRKDEPEKE